MGEPDQSTTSRGALASLIDHRRQAIGKTFRTIALEAGVSSSTVHKIASGRMTQPPSVKTLDGLARALGLSREVLDAAVAADMGVREFVLEQGTPQAAYYAMFDLTADQQEIILSVIAGYRAANRQENSRGAVHP